MLRGTTLVRVLLLLSLTAAAALPLDQAGARPRDPISTEEAEARAAELRFPPFNFSNRPKEEAVDAYRDCVEFATELEFIDTAAGETRKQPLSLWIPARRQSRHAAVVILPTMRGRGRPEDRAASYMCSAGMISIIADVNDTRKPNAYPDWELEDRRNRFVMMALQATLDWASSDPRIDSTRLGTLGISLGAITASIWVGIEPRLKAAMTVVGGGNIPELLSTTDQDTLIEIRRQRMAAANLRTVAEYEEALHRSVRYDPIYFAPLSKAKLKMVSSTGDKTVPYATQLSLWESFKQPERLLYRGDSHVRAIIGWGWGRMGESTQWMKDALDAR